MVRSFIDIMGDPEKILAVPDKEKEDRIEELSLKIFGKKSEDLKYLLVTCFVHQQLLDEELARTGLYQWINVFNGEVKYPRDVADFNEYDIVQVNMSGQDIHLINDIRTAIGWDSKTKLILNNDYTTEAWGRAFDYPTTVEREIRNADMLFGTEYLQTTALSELSGRTCYIVPHPADIKRLKSLTPKPIKPIISTIWRRYDNHYYIPSLVTRNHGLTTQLIGYDRNIDPKNYVATVLYDYVLAGTNYFDFCDQMRESKILYDPFTFNSYSRSTVDTAALGVAVVGSNRTQSCNVCYPHTLVDPYDVRTGRELIQRLLNDKEFYELVVKTALERSEYYNHLNSKLRYLEALNASLEEGIPTDQKMLKKATIERPSGDDVLREISESRNRDGKKN